MIDLHSHILAGIDDGARTLEESIALAKQASEQGVTHMVCTPHIHPGTFDNTLTTIEKSFVATVNAVHQHDIPLKLSYACEVRLGIEVPEKITSNALPFLGHFQGKRVLLLELPHSHIPVGVDSLVRWLTKRDIQVVIPHPERNRDVLAHYEKAIWLKRLGVMFQATAGAFSGTFSESVKQCVWQMLEDKLISYVASDMHNLHKRPNEMKAAFDCISKDKGEVVANTLLHTVPAQITENTQWR
ncbi:histidinol-phosphatase [Glaciecola sp. XM2]|uniref:tyrosine-protein phosphatase n=1 Tax=Glaciecola sp. XM2 TaxID=1914931 RepID=UPI001BDE8769|nr:CpsB/CapC family capsule biosynthesis tyrosine phosphatase [Glaciecola sp. XM2]MBT1452455.1 histidinol-phosphatase [Glaciecola sp. XM2]